MLSNVLMQSLSGVGSNEVLGSVFAVTGAMALSNGNLTATGNTLETWGQAYVNKQVSGSVYVEITAKSFIYYGMYINSGIGISPNLYHRNNDPTNDANFLAFADQSNAVFGISFNAVTGAYAIRKNNVLAKSGTVAVSASNRIMYWGGWGDATPGVGTLNVGATPFVYEPVYL